VMGTGVWNGAEVLEIRGQNGERRSDRLWVSPADGLARVVERTVTSADRRQTSHVRYVMEPPVVHRGESWKQLRREVETAVKFLHEAEATRDVVAAEGLLKRIEQYESLHAETPYRGAIRAARQRAEALRRGDAALPMTATALKLGDRVPDLAFPGLAGTPATRLSQLAGQPVLCIFFKPGSETGPETERFIAAFRAKYPGRLYLVPLVLGNSTPSKTIPQYDAEPARVMFGVDEFPRFELLDAEGILRYRFVGVGPEVGHLVKTELEKWLR
ncbi:MAG: TlpA family protein disulfide reductase, partial [Gemmataceae bacterium]